MVKGVDHLELYSPLGYVCRVMVSSIPKLIIIVRIELHLYSYYTYSIRLAIELLRGYYDSASACCMYVSRLFCFYFYQLYQLGTGGRACTLDRVPVL